MENKRGLLHVYADSEKGSWLGLDLLNHHRLDVLTGI